VHVEVSTVDLWYGTKGWWMMDQILRPDK